MEWYAKHQNEVSDIAVKDSHVVSYGQVASKTI